MAALVGSDRDAVRAFYAPGATVWHNFDDIEQTVEQNLELFEWFAGRLPRRRYRIVRREVLPDGWFQQHVVEADLPDGRPFRLFACCIIRVKDGLITRIDEYVDRSQAAVLRESPRRD
jgi:ketosteroid isomerase-like protein